jgi:hypothetical protein
MKKLTKNIWTIIVLTSFISFNLFGNLHAQSHVYKLANNLSDEKNLNGVWSYNSDYRKNGRQSVILTGVTVGALDTSFSYFEDFNGTVGSEWSNTSTTALARGWAPTPIVLGELSNETVSLTLSEIPTHEIVNVSFELYMNKSTDGSGKAYPSGSFGYGPDIWTLSVDDGPLLLKTTFSSHRWQHYPNSYPEGPLTPPKTGAYKTLSNDDTRYKLFFNFPHNSPTLILNFSASGWQGISDESWALDNVVVNVLPKETAAINPKNNHWYERIDDTMSWHEAKAHCESLEGYLVTITSQDEQDFVFDNLVSNSPYDCWLGATDEDDEGNWHWVTGEDWNFENWDSEEPDNCNSIEHYAVSITPDGSWQDRATLNNGSCGCDCPDDFKPMSTICEWGEIQPILCDFDGDGAVTYDDFYNVFQPAYGTQAGEPGFVPDCDMNQDGLIDMLDYTEWYSCYMDANP